MESGGFGESDVQKDLLINKHLSVSAGEQMLDVTVGVSVVNWIESKTFFCLLVFPPAEIRSVLQ